MKISSCVNVAFGVGGVVEIAHSLSTSSWNDGWRLQRSLP